MSQAKTSPHVKVKSSVRHTRKYVIDYLNICFESTDYDIRFKPLAGVDYMIQVYIQGNELVKEITMNFSLTEKFMKLLAGKLKKIGIKGEPENIDWNNGGNAFSCWVDGATCCWDK